MQKEARKIPFNDVIYYRPDLFQIFCSTDPLVKHPRKATPDLRIKMQILEAKTGRRTRDVKNYPQISHLTWYREAASEAKKKLDD